MSGLTACSISMRRIDRFLVLLGVVALRAHGRRLNASEHAPLRRLSIVPTRASIPVSSQVVFFHFPKTGGTSLRAVVDTVASRTHATMQTHYGSGVTPERHEQFSSLHPAQVIMGHFANFTLLQPVAPGRSVRYVSMVRSPHAWTLSLYLHYHHRARGRRRLLPSWPLAFRGAAHERELGGAGGARVDVAGFLRHSLFVACPALSRGSNETRCEGHLYAWSAGRRRSAGADTCADFAAFWTHPSRLLLANERYDDSIWLLFAMLGAGPPPPAPRKNVRADAAYDAPVTLAAERDVAALLAETCMPDIYAAARGAFERALRVARAACPDARAACDAPARSAAARRLWRPLAGGGDAWL